MEALESEIRSADGKRLHLRSWDAPDPRASLVIVHGLAEHGGRFAEPAAALATRGYATHALDYRGHGKSPGRRVHVRSFQEFRDDVKAAVGAAKAVHPTRPVFLLGHSQGGLIALSLCLLEPETVAGLVLTSPLLGIHPGVRPSLALRLLAGLLAVVWPTRLFPNGVSPAHLSHDPAVAAGYVSDPLVSRTVSAGWYAAATKALREAHAAAPTLTTPTLVLYSGLDRLVDPEATATWLTKAPSSLVESHRYPTLYHEILNEPEKGEVLDRIAAWLGARL